MNKFMESVGWLVVICGTVAITASLALFALHRCWAVYREAKGWPELREAMRVLELKRTGKLIEPNMKLEEILGKGIDVGADGTRAKCDCGREGCIDLWLSAGDRIYVVGYGQYVRELDALIGATND